MRTKRLAFIFLALYLTFLGGSAYYVLILPVRFFHHGFLTVLTSVWLFQRYRNKKGIPSTALNMPIYAMVGVWLITSITSLDPRMAFENSWFFIMHTIIFFAVIDLFQRGRGKMIMEAQFLMGALVVFITSIELASWYLGLGIIPNTEIGWVTERIIPLEPLRVSLAMNISTLLAGYTAPLITLCVGWALTARRKDYRQVLWILAGLLFVVLLLTFSRGGLLSLGTALGVWLIIRIIQSNRIKPRISPQLVGSLTIIGGIGILTFYMLFNISGSRSSGDTVRLDMYRSAIEITIDYPVTGVGVGQYGRAFREYRTPELSRDRLASAHNYPLNTAAETGFMGVVVNVWLALVILRVWWRNWNSADTNARKIRLEAVYTALIGVAVHSMVDVFTTTPVVLVILVLFAYSIIGHRTVLDSVPKGERLPALALLAIVLAYGMFFFQVDRAHLNYQFSLIRNGDEALELARSAEAIDPHLNLYPLHIANLLGVRAIDGQDNYGEAIDAYETALEYEPTWETGWINLAALRLLDGADSSNVLEALQRAHAINPRSQSAYALAVYADNVGALSSDEIITLYQQSISNMLGIRRYLPTSQEWLSTELRQESLNSRLEDYSLMYRYRTWAVLDASRLESLLPQNPESAGDWWVLGEHTLTIENNPEQAIEYFTQAIELNPTDSDLYASRARAYLFANAPDDAKSDINVALLLGTLFEQPNATQAELTSDRELVQLYLANALPPRSNPQEFSTVLYGGRFATFDIPAIFRFPGPGTEYMQPWYELAELLEQQGNLDGAIDVYEMIIDYAPEEIEALEELSRLR